MKKGTKVLLALSLALMSVFGLIACGGEKGPTAEELAEVGITTAMPEVVGNYKNNGKADYATEGEFTLACIWYKTDETASYTALKTWIMANGYVLTPAPNGERIDEAGQYKRLQAYNSAVGLFAEIYWWSEPTQNKIRLDFAAKF